MVARLRKASILPQRGLTPELYLCWVLQGLSDVVTCLVELTDELKAWRGGSMWMSHSFMELANSGSVWLCLLCHWPDNNHKEMQWELCIQSALKRKGQLPSCRVRRQSLLIMSFFMFSSGYLQVSQYPVSFQNGLHLSQRKLESLAWGHRGSSCMCHGSRCWSYP